MTPPPPPPVDGSHVFVASIVALVLLAAITFTLCGLRLAVLRKLVLGMDKRASTSKFQAAVWTFALLFAPLVLLLGHILFGDFDPGWDAFLKAGLNSDYLWLLGIPSAGLVGAKAITQTKVQSNPGSKPAKGADTAGADAAGGDSSNGPPQDGLLARVRELGTDDNDTDPQPALGDLQYLVFNLIAVAYFLTAFLDHVERGLPSLPDTLIALTGVSAASYLSTKAVKQAAPPLIVSVRPLRVVLGETETRLEVSATGLLGATGQGGEPAATLGGVTLDVEAGATAEHLAAIVPIAAVAKQRGLTSGKLDLVVYTPGGQPSTPTSLDVLEEP
jgi:hypothetical protein